MSDTQPTVLSVNISRGGIPKQPIDAEDLDDLRAEGYDVGPGALGENLTVRGLDVDALAPGDRLRFSGGVELEYTKPRKPCYVLDAINPLLKEVVKGRCGGYAKVIIPGEIRAGETIDVQHAAPHRT